MAQYLELSEEDFIGRHAKLHPSRSGLMLKSHPDGTGIFFEGSNTSRIEPVKTKQCRDFPNGWNFPERREHC